MNVPPLVQDLALYRHEQARLLANNQGERSVEYGQSAIP